MSAYNKLNGVYLSEHRRILDDILRREWGFEGIVVTDWGANNDRIAGLIAGQDLDMPGSGSYHARLIEAAIREGRLEEEVLDGSVQRLLELIDKAERTKAVTEPSYDPDEHHNLARRIAGEGSVLLKNDDKVLPLDRTRTTALIGGFATSPRYQGAGSSRIHPIHLVTPLDAFREELGDRLTTAKGYDPSSDEIDEAWIAEAVNVAKQAEQVVVIVGLPDTYESEGFDREHLNLPPSHNRLVEAIAAVHDEVVVVLQNGAPVVLPWHDDVAAILEVYLGGEAGGEAMVDVLFGRTRPSGRLAESFPRHLSDVPADQHFPGTDNQVTYREGLYVGYRAFDTLGIEPLFPFGFGLSYSTFSHEDIQVVLEEERIRVTLSITNHDEVDDKEVIQVYVGHPNSIVARPKQELKGYTKVTVPAHGTKQVQLDIPLDRLAIFQDGNWKIERGTYHVMVGRSSRDILAEYQIEVTSTDEVLADAPSVYFDPDPSFAPTLEDFQTLLGRDVPRPSTQRPFTVNSTMEDVQASFAGRLLHRLVAKQLTSVVGDDLDAVSRRMIERSLAEMPLRNLAIMSGGALSMRRLLGLIDWMNRKPLRGLIRVIRG
jgi:beta-glucosidase